MSESQERPTNVRWLVFALACLSSWFLYLHRYTWNFIGPQLEKEYGWSSADVLGLYALFNITYGWGQLPTGMLCDYLGPHLLLAAIIALWSLALPMLGLSSSYSVVGGVRLMFGMAQAGCYPTLAKVTRSWFPPGYRTMVQGAVASFCGRGGGALSPIIMATLLMGYCGLPWRTALWILSAAGVLFALVFLWLFRDSPEIDPRVNAAELKHISGSSAPAAAPVGRVIPWGRAILNPSMLFFIAMQFFAAGIDNMYSSLMGNYCISRGIDIKSAGFLASAPLIGGMIGGMLAAVLNDVLIRRIGRRWGRSLIGVFANVMACLAMFVLIRQTTVVGAGLGLLAVKFFADMTQPTQWGACTDIGGRYYSATVFAIINTAGNMGGIVFPLIFGMILKASRTIGMQDGVEQKDFGPLFLFAAGIYVAAAVCWALIDCTRTLDEPEERPAGEA